MRIWWHRNARIYEGSPVEIVKQMQFQEMTHRDLSLNDYVDHLIHEAVHWGFTLQASGDTPEARATSLVVSMLNQKLARLA